MEKREDTLVWNQFKIIHLNLDLPFCKSYQVVGLVDNKPYFLFDYEKEAAPSSLQGEVNLWLSDNDSLFPEVVEVKEEGVRTSVVLSKFQGTPIGSLVTMSVRPLAEEKVFDLVPELRRLFSKLHKLQIALPGWEILSNRIFFTADAKIRLVPVLLFQHLDKNASLPHPLGTEAEPVPEAVYLQSFGRFLCYLLTQTFPVEAALPEQVRTLLPTDTATLLDSLIGGKVESFEEFDRLLKLLREERQRAQEQARIEEEQVEAPVVKPRPPTLYRDLAALGKGLAAVLLGLLRALQILVQLVAFLVFLVATYYWERARELVKLCKRTYRKMQAVSWFEIRTFFKREFKRFGTDIKKIHVSFLLLFPVSQVELLNFTRHLAALLKAGVAFPRAIDILYQQNTNPRLKNSLVKVYHAVVQRGLPLSKGLALAPEVFSELYINMLTAGEITGKVDQVLSQIAAYIERDLTLRQKVKAASTYPLFIAAACFGLFSFFVYVILPKLFLVFEGLNIEFPLPTRILIAIIRFAHSPAVILLTLIGAVVLLFPLLAFFKTLLGKEKADSIKLQIPVFGRLYKKILLARFCSTLGTLVQCGVSLLESLEVTGRASGNEFFNQIMLQVMEETRVGMALNTTLEKIVFFPSLVVSMVKIGEESGNLEQMLLKMAEIYEGDVNYLLQQFVSLIEPLLMAVMGIVVGFVVMAVFLPIYAIVRGVEK